LQHWCRPYLQKRLGLRQRYHLGLPGLLFEYDTLAFLSYSFFKKDAFQLRLRTNRQLALRLSTRQLFK
jgi:hypothetical protein